MACSALPVAVVVLRSEAHGVKVSLRSDTMLPVRAMVDPDLTLSVPPEMTAVRLERFLARIATSWDRSKFFSRLERFGVPTATRFDRLSKGQHLPVKPGCQRFTSPSKK